MALSLDRAGNLYVADAGTQRIDKLSSSGDLLAEWGGDGTAPGRFHHPEGIAVDGDGLVAVADTDNYRLQKFSPAGMVLEIVRCAWLAGGTHRATCHRTRS